MPRSSTNIMTELYGIDGPWAGRLAIMPRPRGGDWLEDELQSWRRSGVDVLVSLLTSDEQADLDLMLEQDYGQGLGMQFISLPIVDRSVPDSRPEFTNLVKALAEFLAEGRKVAIHCRQGIGRAALTAIGVLLQSGVDVATAIERVGKARGCSVPETNEQRRWIEGLARSLLEQ